MGRLATIIVWVILVGALLADPAAIAKGDSEALTIAIGGDMLGPYHGIADIEDAGFQEITALFRDADIVVVNQEGSIFDADKHEFYPSAENNGLPLAPEAVARELRGMNITLMSKANNHAVDWGLEGLRATEIALERSGIAPAGSGGSESAARAAKFVETQGGMVALVSLASTFQAMARAADPGHSTRGPTRARPGISVIRLSTSMRLPPEDFATVRALAAKYGDDAKDGGATLGNQRYVAGKKQGLSFTMDLRDVKGVLGAVSAAAAETPATLVAIHAHETDSSDPDDPVPPDFLVTLAHDAVDRGAAAVVRHGPHGVNGIEIYKGRPIFYGVGSLYFDFGGKRSYTVPDTGQVIRFPDTWFEGFLATLMIRNGRPERVILYPFLLDDTPTEKSGMPRPAKGMDARRILERVQRYSQSFGTMIEIQNGVGTIALSR